MDKSVISLCQIFSGFNVSKIIEIGQYLTERFGTQCALCVVGLIHANHGGEMIDYLLSQLRDATSDVVRHGGCLGVGLAAMGTARQDVYDQLKHCLELDDAVTGLYLADPVIYV